MFGFAYDHRGLQTSAMLFYTGNRLVCFSLDQCQTVYETPDHADYASFDENKRTGGYCQSKSNFRRNFYYSTEINTYLNLRRRFVTVCILCRNTVQESNLIVGLRIKIVEDGRLHSTFLIRKSCKLTALYLKTMNMDVVIKQFRKHFKTVMH